MMKNRAAIRFGGILLLALSLGAAWLPAYAAAAETDPASREELHRSAVSSFIFDTDGFFHSGAYERYLDEFINAQTPPVQNKAQDRSEDQPNNYFDFMGMDETVSFMGAGPEDVYHSRAFLSSLFYMEIPQDWYVGASASCPLVFCHESDRSPSSLEGFKEYYDVFPSVDFFDEEAQDENALFVLDGGVNEVLEEALGQPVTEEMVIRQDEPGSGWFSLNKDGKLLANFYVWAWLGKVAVWPNDIQVKYRPSEDHGRIHVFQEWEDQDFSTPEAIRDYVKSGGADHLLEPVLGPEGIWGGIWKCSEIETEYHRFLRFEGRTNGLRAAFYIPVTPDYNENWLILFEASENTKEAENAFSIQDRVLKTFILQPYYYVVKKGDTLSAIARKYTDNPNSYAAIAQYKPNRVRGRAMNPHLIFPGQEIYIPLDLLFQKKHYQ